MQNNQPSNGGNNWFRFNPYHAHHVRQECSSPSSSEVTPRSASSSERRRRLSAFACRESSPSTAMIVPPRDDANLGTDSAVVPNSAVHRQVLTAEGVSFLPFPAIIERPSHWPAFPTIDGPFPDLRVFFGQCRFETTAEEVAFVLWHTAGLAPHSIARHRPGCFVANFLTVEEVAACVQLHRNLLFDVCGVWVAQSRSQSDAIKRYVATSPVSLFKRYRIPRGLVVAEHFQSVQASPISHISPDYLFRPLSSAPGGKWAGHEPGGSLSDDDNTGSLTTSSRSVPSDVAREDLPAPFLW